MRYKLFGHGTGLRVSEFALGCGLFGTRWGYGAEPSEARRMLDAYLDAGGNFIDTADGYEFGESEELLGEFLQSRRGDVGQLMQIQPLREMLPTIAGLRRAARSPTPNRNRLHRGCRPGRAKPELQVHSMGKARHS